MKQIYRLGSIHLFSATARRAFVLAFLCMIAVSSSYAQQKETSDLHNNRARALSAAGNLKGAIAEYQAALQLDPNSVEALNNLALLYATASDTALRDPSKALKYALQAVAIDNERVAGHLDTLAKAYEANGDHLNAMKTEQSALNLLAKDSTRRPGFETSLARYKEEEGTAPTDTAAFVSYCANHFETCRNAVLDTNNYNMIRQIGGNRACTFPRFKSSEIHADSIQATKQILAWMNDNITSLISKRDDAIQQAMAALWPSECKAN